MVLDGAMGTMVQELAGSDAGLCDLLNLSDPLLIGGIHARYLEAGANIIETNTFSANRLTLEGHGFADRVAEINLRGAQIAREQADRFNALDRGKPRYVAGVLGPGSKAAGFSTDVEHPGARGVTFGLLAEAYLEQARALQEGGVDLFLVETVYDTVNAKAALYALGRLHEESGVALPVMLSATVNSGSCKECGSGGLRGSLGLSGRLLCGQELEAFLISVSHFPLWSVGLNCSFGPESMKPYLRQLRLAAKRILGEGVLVSAHPNAGLPDLMGRYSQTPQIMAGHVRELLLEGLVDIVGGCCGTTPEHIREIAKVVEEVGLETGGGVEGNNVLPGGGSASGIGSAADSANALSAGSASKNRFAGQRPLMLSGLEPLVAGSVAGGGGSDAGSDCGSVAGGDGLGVGEGGSLASGGGFGAGAFFVNVGERTNVAGSRKFLRLIKDKDYAAAVEIARMQAEGGAMVVDVNMDDGMLDAVAEMREFLNRLVAEPEVARLPVMIDSSRWEVQKAALEVLPGKSVVNSISLKEGEEHFLWQAREIRKYGAAVVVMAFDELGQADSFERRVEICSRAYRLLTQKAGYGAEDIIFDTNIFPVGTGMEEHRKNAVDFFRAAAWIRENLPGVGVSGGVSNVSFAFRGNNRVREAMHSAFLYHGVRHGMTMAIVNPEMLEVYDRIDSRLLTAVEDVLLDRREDATERLLEVAQVLDKEGFAGGAVGVVAGGGGVGGAGGVGAGGGRAGVGCGSGAGVGGGADWRAGGVAERLSAALVRGREEFLARDIEEALQQGFLPQEIIEKLLMVGMREVGELFGSGKMFLPQVIKSARVMKSAVALVTPYLAGVTVDGGSASAGVGVAGGVSTDSGSGVASVACGVSTDSGSGVASVACGVSTDSGSGVASVADGGGSPLVMLATVKGDVHDIGKNIVAVVLSCNGCRIDDMGVMIDAEAIAARAESLQPDVIGLSGLITPSLNEMINVVRALEKRGLSIPVLVGGATTSRIHTAVKIAPEYGGPVVHVPDASVAAQVVSRLLGDYGGYCKELDVTYARLREGFYGRRSEVSLLPLEVARDNRLRLDWNGVDLPAPVGVTEVVFDAGELLEFVDWREYVKLWGVEPDEGTELLVKNSGFVVKAVYGVFEAVGRADDSIEVWSGDGAGGDGAGDGSGGAAGSGGAGGCAVGCDGGSGAGAAGGCDAGGAVGGGAGAAGGCDAGGAVAGSGGAADYVVHMLRQQMRKPDGEANLCLADYVLPAGAGHRGVIGAFCVSVTGGGQGHFVPGSDFVPGNDGVPGNDNEAGVGCDVQNSIRQNADPLVLDSLAHRLAEAASRKLQSMVAPSGIRPAPGFPSAPDHLEKQTIWDLLDVQKRLGAVLTESMVMVPVATVCGYYFFHPACRYFGVGLIGRDQLEEYARRRGISVNEMSKWLSQNIL